MYNSHATASQEERLNRRRAALSQAIRILDDCLDYRDKSIHAKTVKRLLIKHGGRLKAIGFLITEFRITVKEEFGDDIPPELQRKGFYFNKVVYIEKSSTPR